MNTKQDIFRSLKQQILLREGFKEPLLTEGIKLGRIDNAFPNGVFPFAALHEFFCFNAEEEAASTAFIAGLLSSRNCKEQSIVWISASQKIFPPALKRFGILPQQVLFLQVKKDKDISWAIDEALKCASLSAVVAELPEMTLTASRRFQLAIEGSGVGCFILRNRPKNLLTTAVTRWQVQPSCTITEKHLPGIGHPHWEVQLLKARNGKPGIWKIEWVGGRFQYSSKLAVIHKAR